MDRIGRFYSLSCPLTVAGYPWSQLHSGSVIMTIASMPFWIQVQVQVLAGPGCFVQRSTGLDRTGHTPNRAKETAGWRARERAAARIQAQADPKQKMSNFVIYYPNPVSVSDSLGVSLRQRHTRRAFSSRAAEREGNSPLSHTACEFVAQFRTVVPRT